MSNSSFSVAVAAASRGSRMAFLRGAEQMGADLRVWERGGEPVAIGMLDGSEVLRISVAPEVAQDHAVAEGIAADLTQPATDLFAGDDAVVEARGATVLRRILKSAGLDR